MSQIPSFILRVASGARIAAVQGGFGLHDMVLPFVAMVVCWERTFMRPRKSTQRESMVILRASRNVGFFADWR